VYPACSSGLLLLLAFHPLQISLFLFPYSHLCPLPLPFVPLSAFLPTRCPLLPSFLPLPFGLLLAGLVLLPDCVVCSLGSIHPASSRLFPMMHLESSCVLPHRQASPMSSGRPCRRICTCFHGIIGSPGLLALGILDSAGLMYRDLPVSHCSLFCSWNM
jgi:hypothetical protein